MSTLRTEGFFSIVCCTFQLLSQVWNESNNFPFRLFLHDFFLGTCLSCKQRMMYDEYICATKVKQNSARVCTLMIHTYTHIVYIMLNIFYFLERCPPFLLFMAKRINFIASQLVLIKSVALSFLIFNGTSAYMIVVKSSNNCI